MTWQKTSPELYDQMAADDLSVEAGMAHMQGLGWLYRLEKDDCLIPSRLIKRGLILPMSDDPEAAAMELVRAGYWTQHGTCFEVVNHSDVVRSSLTAQRNKRAKDKRGQATARARRQSPSSDASSDDAADESSATQSNNQTSKQPAVRERSEPTAPRNAMGTCRACDHREPLDDSGRCPSCVAWDVTPLPVT